MRRYMFFLTLAQWAVAKALECDGGKIAGDLVSAYSELNIARGWGSTVVVPASHRVVVQLSKNKLGMIERWSTPE